MAKSNFTNKVNRRSPRLEGDEPTNDAFDTPPLVCLGVTRYLRHYFSDIDYVWEIAAGCGNFVNSFESEGVPCMRGDIKPRAEGIQRFDFLHDQITGSMIECLTHKSSWIVTNPPFNQWIKFSNRAFSYFEKEYITGIVFLMQTTAQNAQTAGIYEMMDKRCVPVMPRPEFVPGGASTLDVSLHIWRGEGVMRGLELPRLFWKDWIGEKQESLI